MIHGVHRVFGKLLNQCPMPFWPFSAQVVAKAPWSPFMLFEIKGDAVHLSPIPWPFFCGYAAPVHLKTSLSVNIMLADSTQLCFGLGSPFYFCWFALQSSGSVVQILVWPILMHENSAANMEHFPVSVQHKGKSLNPRVVFHMPLSVLYVVPNFYGCSKEKVLSVLLVMSKRTLSYMVHNEIWLGDYVSIFASGCMSLWPSWVQEDNQHQPWPPPVELRLTIYAAELGPVQWPLFDMLERFSVMC